ncbi:hypothetical protein [Alysiella filiformis]|nr:hypothetical protein [Alysiella filiformis]UBQ56621.1 hypothetical protein JF568_02260 [Alysiella filiformis DSM 16848]
MRNTKDKSFSGCLFISGSLKHACPIKIKILQSPTRHFKQRETPCKP